MKVFTSGQSLQMAKVNVVAGYICFSTNQGQ
jgi:hypothetical protein